MYPHSFRRGSEFQFFFRPNSIFRKLISLLAIWALTIGTLPAYAAPLPRYGPPVLAGQKALLPQLPEPLLQKQMARIAGGQLEQPKFALQRPIARLAAPGQDAAETFRCFVQAELAEVQDHFSRARAQHQR